jgi:hypothetical protein
MTNAENDVTEANEPVRVSAFGTKEKDTPNAVRFATEWGVQYLPKLQLAKLGNPTRIKITVEAAND